MGVISPSGAIYGVPPDIGFSFPVKTENQKWEVITVNFAFYSIRLFKKNLYRYN